jgi:cell division transport system permease protein
MIQKENLMKILSSFLYNVKQGLKGILSNRTMSFISIGSVSASLIILGIVISMVLNTNQFIENTKDEINEIRASIPSGLSQHERDLIKEQIKTIDGVKGIRYQTKDVAFDDMKDSWGEDAYLLDGMKNPLDNYFIITISDSNNIDKIANNLSQIKNISEINYYQDIMSNFVSITNTIKKVGSIIIICLFIVCLFMISNTIRARVHSKKEEIKIMRYVGASNAFVRAPFLIEGFTIGIIGALISIIINVLMYRYIYNSMGASMKLISSGTVLIPTQNIAIILSIVSLLIGTIIGILGSTISIRKHLRV